MIQARLASWTPDVLQTLAHATAADPFGGLASTLECVRNAYLLELTERGAPFALVAVEPMRLAAGVEMHIVAGVRTGPSTSRTPAALEAIAAWSRGQGAHVVTAVTADPRLAHVASRAGWRCTGQVIAQRLQGAH